jgi:hypothetical protein
VTSLSGSSQREVEDNREKWGDFWEKLIAINIKKSQVCKTPLVKIDRNKYLTLNRCPLGNYE